MAQVYTKSDYHLKANKKIPKRGAEIFDEDGNSALSLYRGINDNSKVILLSYTNHSVKDETVSKNYNELTKEDFKDILSLARDYAIQNGYNLIVHEPVAKKFDIQNFISSGENKYTAMTNDEIKLLNDSDITAQVVIPDRFKEENSRFSFFNKNKIINDNGNMDISLNVVSSGRIKIDRNNQDDNIGIILNKESNDYSNIVDVTNSKIEDDKLKLYLSYSGEGEYNISDTLNENVVIQIPTEVVNRKIPLEDGRYLDKSLKIITLPDDAFDNLVSNHKTFVSRSSSDCRWLLNRSKSLLSVADGYKYPELEEDLKSIDKILYLYENKREALVEDKFFCGSEKDQIEKTVNELKDLRKKFPEIKPDNSLTM